MDTETRTATIEALLFTSDKPVPVSRLCEVLGEESHSQEAIFESLEQIKSRYLNHSFGFELREAQGGYHFVTKPAHGEWVRKFLAMRPFKLGRSALETLAIIAYRQPVTRAEIDKVRGIDSSHLLRTLIERGIVKMAGKAEVPGRPVQYKTTPRFLEIVGLPSLADLPPLTELEQLQGHTQPNEAPLEEGLEKFLAVESGDAAPVPDDDPTGLAEIEGLIHSAGTVDNEIYASPLHAEVARENQASLDGFLTFFRPLGRSKKRPTENDVPLL